MRRLAPHFLALILALVFAKPLGATELSHICWEPSCLLEEAIPLIEPTKQDWGDGRIAKAAATSLASLGRLPEALNLARSIKDDGGRSAARAMGRIAVAEQRAGDIEKSKLIVDEAVRMLDRIDPDDPFHPPVGDSYISVACDLVVMGRTVDALALVRRVASRQPEYFLSEALSQIAAVDHRNGNREVAKNILVADFKVTLRIVDETHRVLGLIAIVHGWLDMDSPESALQAALSIQPNPDHYSTGLAVDAKTERNVALEDICHWYELHAEYKAALSTVRSISAPLPMAAAIGDLTAVLVRDKKAAGQIGILNASDRLLQNLDNPVLEATYAPVLATAFYQAGMDGKFDSLTKKVGDLLAKSVTGPSREEALAAVAVQTAITGSLQSAYQMAATQLTTFREATEREILHIASSKGQTAFVLKTAEDARSWSLREDAYFDLARSEADADNFPLAASYISMMNQSKTRALDHARISQARRAQALVDVAQIMILRAHPRAGLEAIILPIDELRSPWPDAAYIPHELPP